jgi:AraC-like DNA-binding protein
MDVFSRVTAQMLSHRPLPPLHMLKYCDYPAGLVSDFHQMDAIHQALLILSGNAIFQEEDGEELKCAPGTFVAIPLGCSYKWRMPEPVRMFQCHHDAFLYEQHRELSFLFGRASCQLTATDVGVEWTSRVESRIAEIEKEASWVKDSQLSLATFELFVRALASRGGINGECGEHPAIERAIAHMRAGIRKELELNAVARAAGMGASRLTQLFRERFGMPPMQYFARLKADKAMEMILSTRLGVGEIACALGFSTVNYFSRFFKRWTGISPQTARNRNKV